MERPFISRFQRRRWVVTVLKRVFLYYGNNTDNLDLDTSGDAFDLDDHFRCTRYAPTPT